MAAKKKPAWFNYAVLGAAGGATFLLAFHAASSSNADTVVESVAASGARVPDDPAPPAAAPRARAAGDGDKDMVAPPDLPRRAPIGAAHTRNPFAVLGWVPPPPPPPPAPVVAVVAPPPPPPPTAPPLPFTFVGMLEDKARPAAFLAKGDALLIVHAGETIENTYRVDALSPAAVILTYLPLDQRQTLAVNGGKP